MAMRTVIGLATAGLGLATGLVVGAAARAAQLSVTPPRRTPNDVRVLAGGAGRIVLNRSIETTLPGRYSLRFANGAGHAKIGEVIESDERSVTRAFLGLDAGELHVGTRGWMGAWYYWDPFELDLPFEEVSIPTDFGPAPAWRWPADPGHPRAQAGHWAILVHGRGVDRRETLRAVPTFREAGYECLSVSYRNDGVGPRSQDHRYGLGSTESQDVEAAIEWALAHGARRIVLMGFSMGGAVVLQIALRRRFAEVLDGLVLDSPAVEWRSILAYHARAMHLPELSTVLAMGFLSSPAARMITGLQQPIDLDELDVVARAKELDLPILLMHSLDDLYVPADASVALAEARPDIVRFEEYTVAGHTRLWNAYPERWTSEIADWLSRVPLAVDAG